MLERPRGRGDFYGSLLRLALIGYIRPEIQFKNIGELVRRIKEDTLFTKQACALASSPEPERLTGEGVQVEDRASLQRSKARKLFAHCVRPFLETTDPSFQYSTALGSSSTELSLESSSILTARQQNQNNHSALSEAQSVTKADNPQFLCAVSIDAILSKLGAAH